MTSKQLDSAQEEDNQAHNIGNHWLMTTKQLGSAQEQANQAHNICNQWLSSGTSLQVIRLKPLFEYRQEFTQYVSKF